MQTPYDLAVVLGTRFTQDFKLRQDLIDRLDKTAELYAAGTIKKLLVSGRWTIWYDWLGVTPPTTEAALMKQYLVAKGVSPRDITKETRSMDTIGNIYYLNAYLTQRPRIQSLLIICATPRITRVKHLAKTIMSPHLHISYCEVDAPDDAASSLGIEQDILAEQKVLLRRLLNDTASGRQHRLYSDRYYRDQARGVRNGSIASELHD